MSTRRDAERIAREAEAEMLPDPWAMAVDVILGELAEREARRLREPWLALSRDGLVLLAALLRNRGELMGTPVTASSDTAGQTVAEWGVDLRAALDELFAAGCIVPKLWGPSDDEWPPVWSVALVWPVPLSVVEQLLAP